MTAHPATAGADVVVVGGGLAGQLVVLALARHAPTARVALVERAARPGGNHTWCCHRTDLDHASVDAGSLGGWFDPLVSRRWPAHLVRFPHFARVLEGEYLCLRSSDLAKATMDGLARTRGIWRGGADVVAVGPRHVELASGEIVPARLVLDARGAAAVDFAGRTGYQKFIGWELELAGSSSAQDDLPTLMDAAVAQVDGYRFVYTLPFTPTRVLVEDTYFSRHADFPLPAARDRLRAHLQERGLSATVVREESGVLPMPWALPTRPPAALAIGYRGGFFHPGTGYSLARAAIVAERLAALVAAGAADLPGAATDVLAGVRASYRASDEFARLLNRLAFRLVRPDRLRDAIFARVYRLPEPVLARFYAGQTSRRDRLALAAAPLGVPVFGSLPRPAPLLGATP